MTIPLLAKEFSRILQECFMPALLKQAIARNETAEYKRACATHDFCNANLAMDEAFENLGWKGISDFETDSPEQVAAMDLWNKAWDYAKANKFFVIGESIPTTTSGPIESSSISFVRVSSILHWCGLSPPACTCRRERNSFGI
jgi:hypothetical protein